MHTYILYWHRAHIERLFNEGRKIIRQISEVLIHIANQNLKKQHYY